MQLAEISYGSKHLIINVVIYSKVMQKKSDVQV